MSNTKEEKKVLGAFYTPQPLANLLARMVVSLQKFSKNNTVTVLDPATGDSILLQSFAKYVHNDSIIDIIGIDINKKAVRNSKALFAHSNVVSNFIHTDGLYPLGYSVPQKGWSVLKEKFAPEGIDIIVSNPPWGANLDKYHSLSLDFGTASGQFDIYDLFIETIIYNLKDGGVYGIIVPDSIYCQEHQKIREILFDNTTIKGIIRLGEGFFPDVNFSVSIVYGIKKKSKNYKIGCSHISNQERKAILMGEKDIYDIVIKKMIKIPAKQMIDAGYNFIVDVNDFDLPVLTKIRNQDILKKYTSTHRGTELSKKGIIHQCNSCSQWFPAPRIKSTFVKCPHCGMVIDKRKIKTDCIISDSYKTKGSPILVGEDIGRYKVSKGKYIKLGFEGINYKSQDFYCGPKVLVRKTGVGITAGIDYSDSYTNQVVYIYKPKEGLNRCITPEVIAAILCSRLTTYVIIKEKGSIGWTSNAYLSQDDVSGLPFPSLDLENEKTVSVLNTITRLVRSFSLKQTEIIPEIDAKIERCVAFLFQLEKADYDIVFQTIHQVEQMIPFKRLLNIKSEDIFRYGI